MNTTIIILASISLIISVLVLIKIYRSEHDKKFALSTFIALIPIFLAVAALFKSPSATGPQANTTPSPNTDSYIYEKLSQAELAFNAGDYQQMEEIYMDGNLTDSAIRNNNLGYSYANGLYVAPDLEKAEFYFDKAIAADFEPAYANKFRALMVQEKITEAEDLILEWNKLKEHNLFIEYFNKNIASIYNGSVDDFCTHLTSDDRIFILKELLENEYLGIICTETLMFDSSENGEYHYFYHLVNEESRLNPDGLSTTITHTYKQYKLSIVDETFLNRFVSLEH